MINTLKKSIWSRTQSRLCWFGKTRSDNTRCT
jgi:hypothetical protein